MLHRREHHLGRGVKARDVVRRIQAEPRAHGRQVGVARRTGLVARRPQVARVALLHREADGVADETGLHLVEPHEAGKDGQARRVGRRPPRRPQLVGAEVEDRARPGGARTRVVRGERLVQLARGLVDDQHVRVAALLDLQVVAVRVWARVALARVLERVVGGRVAGVDHIKRYAVGRPAKVGVQQAPAAGAGRVEPRGAVAVHRHRADVGVPDVAGRKDVAARARNGRRARVDRWPVAGKTGQQQAAHAEHDDSVLSHVSR